MNPAVESIVIIGSGPAGLTAAIYSARANLTPICIEGLQPGGQLTITSDVENYPGFADPILGPELMESFKKQAERFGTRFIQGNVESIDLQKQPFGIGISRLNTIKTRSVILATGASAKWLNIPSEKRLMGKGVSACATCDGFFFKNMDLAVVGGGDTAMEEANFLTRFAKSITLIHRREKFRASKIMQDKVSRNSKIKVVFNSEVEEILGEKSVQGLLLRQADGAKVELSVQGVFVAIGHQPNTEFIRDKLECDKAGYIRTRLGSTLTSVPGVFAAGDVMDAVYRQAVTAAGTGCMAAMDAEKYLESIH